MAKATPGPWEIEGRSGDGKSIFVTAAGDGWRSLDCEVDSDDCCSETAMANARLIAAAPDLLAACKAALPVLTNAIEAGCDDPETAAHAVANHKTLNLLRAVIAKAEDQDNG